MDFTIGWLVTLLVVGLLFVYCLVLVVNLGVRVFLGCVLL